MLNLPWDIMLMILELLDFRALKAFATTMHAIKDSRLGPCTTPEDLINVVMKPRVAQMLTLFCPDLQAFLTLLRDTNARVYGQLPLSLVLGNRHKWTLTRWTCWYRTTKCMRSRHGSKSQGCVRKNIII